MDIGNRLVKILGGGVYGLRGGVEREGGQEIYVILSTIKITFKNGGRGHERNIWYEERQQKL